MKDLSFINVLNGLHKVRCKKKEFFSLHLIKLHHHETLKVRISETGKVNLSLCLIN
jgi:hypothetical protein